MKGKRRYIMREEMRASGGDERERQKEGLRKGGKLLDEPQLI